MRWAYSTTLPSPHGGCYMTNSTEMDSITWEWSYLSANMHCESKKLCHFYFYCNFGKCWSILVWMFAWNWRFCVEKHQTSFLQICGLQTVQISIQLITRSVLSCISVVYTRGNPHHRRSEAEADWSLVRPWTVDCRHGCWSVAQKT